MSAPARFSIYDGRCFLGAVAERGERFEALLPTGKSLGLFNSLRAAGAAIEHEHVRQCDPAGVA